MKKFLFPLLLFGAISLQAQSYFSENFDGENPLSDWEVFFGNNGAGAIDNWQISDLTFVSPSKSAFVSFNSLNDGLAEDWLVTPLIDLTGSSNPVLTFFTRQAYEEELDTTYKVLISTTSPTNVNAFTELLSMDEYDNPLGYWGVQEIDLSAFQNQQVYIAFQMINAYGDEWFLDDISVYEKAANDAKIIPFEMAEKVSPSTHPLKFLVYNLGSQNISQLQVKWQINNGEIHTAQSMISPIYPGYMDYVNIPEGLDLSSSAGDTPISVWIETVNNQEDINSFNNRYDFSRFVASGFAPKMILYEEITSYSCGYPCDLSNEVVNPFIQNNESTTAMIRYPVSWTTPLDPFYTTDSEARNQYYEDFPIMPTIFTDGSRDLYYLDQQDLDEDYEVKFSNKGLFQIQAEHTLDNNGILVSGTILPYISGEYHLRCAVVEKTVESNGVTRENYLMEMVPNPQGELITFNDQQPIEFNLEAAFDNSLIQDFNDLEIILWIQNDENKVVYQATKSTENLGIADHQQHKFSFYPNPAKSEITFQTDESMTVQLYNSLGQSVMKPVQVEHNSSLPVSHFQPGVYLMTAKNEKTIIYKKVIIR